MSSVMLARNASKIISDCNVLSDDDYKSLTIYANLLYNKYCENIGKNGAGKSVTSECQELYDNINYAILEIIKNRGIKNYETYYNLILHFLTVKIGDLDASVRLLSPVLLKHSKYSCRIRDAISLARIASGIIQDTEVLSDSAYIKIEKYVDQIYKKHFDEKKIDLNGKTKFVLLNSTPSVIDEIIVDCVKNDGGFYQNYYCVIMHLLTLKTNDLKAAESVAFGI